MTDNDYRSDGDTRFSSQGLRPHTEERTLQTQKIQIERKIFVFSLRENSRGRFLRITEDVGGRRDAIIVPAPGLDEFCRAVAGLARAAAESPVPPLLP